VAAWLNAFPAVTQPCNRTRMQSRKQYMGGALTCTPFCRKRCLTLRRAKVQLADNAQQHAWLLALAKFAQLEAGPVASNQLSGQGPVVLACCIPFCCCKHTQHASLPHEGAMHGCMLSTLLQFFRTCFVQG
jgi:hypothetical protein